jgi:hypothetical protein
LVDKSVAVQLEPVETNAQAVPLLTTTTVVADPDIATLLWRLRPMRPREAEVVDDVRSVVVKLLRVMLEVATFKWPDVVTQSTVSEPLPAARPGATLATPEVATGMMLMVLDPDTCSARSRAPEVVT